MQAESAATVEEIVELILEKKGHNVSIINFAGKSDIADAFIIATIDSDPQAKAVAEHIVDSLKTGHGRQPLHRDGQYKLDSWIVLDYGDIIIHLFKPAERQRYNLEKLWFEADIRHIDDDQARS
jgi:ribosome-associated protein